LDSVPLKMAQEPTVFIRDAVLCHYHGDLAKTSKFLLASSKRELEIVIRGTGIQWITYGQLPDLHAKVQEMGLHQSHHFEGQGRAADPTLSTARKSRFPATRCRQSRLFR
jgi:hypothetical protein